MRKGTLYIILLLLLSTSAGLAGELPDITKHWVKLVEQYKVHMAAGEWSGAVERAEQLMDVDPASSEARFYALYAYKKMGLNPVELNDWSRWPYGSINNWFYRELAKDIK